jgi:hypothetical protein
MSSTIPRRHLCFTGLSQKGDFKQFTPFAIYCRGGKAVNFGLLRQPHFLSLPQVKTTREKPPSLAHGTFLQEDFYIFGLLIIYLYLHVHFIWFYYAFFMR